MKKITLLLCLLILAACGDGDSDSGGDTADSQMNDVLPANFVGVYTGTIEATATAIGIISLSETYPITITVTADNMIRFDGDEPDETFTAVITNDGAFSGGLPFNDEDCTATINTEGTVDGVIASGTVDGSGVCLLDGNSVDVTLEGTFTATR